jgi:hypothetical protein
MKDEDELEFISVSQEDENYNDMMNSTYSDPVQTNDNVVGSWILKQSKHPLAIFFHLLFKALAIFMYMFGSWFTSNFIFIFVICIILLAFDFWTVKNVSGRLLVGLRWWSYVKDDGSNEWIFESLEDMAEISQFDSRVFWAGLYISPIWWSILFVVGLLRLELTYLPLVVAAFVLNSANVVGYSKCSSKAREKMQGLQDNGRSATGGMQALENGTFRSWIINFLLGIASDNVASRSA